MRPARTADNSAVQVVPNIKLRVEVQHFSRFLSLHDLSRESFSFYSLYTPYEYTLRRIMQTDYLAINSVQPHVFRGSSSLLSNGYKVLLPRSNAAGL